MSPEQIQDLYFYMLDSKEWREKERLFCETFPDPAMRVRLIGDFAELVIREHHLQGQSTDHLNDLLIRKMAIEWWFGLIPKSLLKRHAS